MKVDIIENEKKFIADKVVLIDFPQLLGSERQIAYGEKEREKKVYIMEIAYKNFKNFLISYHGEDAEYLPSMDKEKEEWFMEIYNERSAKTWIECEVINYGKIEQKFKKYIID